MAEEVRFYADQHWPGAVTQSLRQRGIDILTAQDAGRCSLSDRDQLAFATAQDRVMVTFDADYLALHRAGVPHAGIAWCPQQKYAIRTLVKILELLHQTIERDRMRNRVEYL